MKELRFTIHTPNLLKEIVECALPKENGILYQPINELRLRFIELSKIAQEIQNPKLLLWCYDMTLFDEADPDNKNYNPNMRKKILELIKELERK